jgi:hypothetical protein
VDSDKPPEGTSRRDAIKTALKAGAYAAPVILAAGRPTPVSAQVTGPTGTLTGTITDARTALPIGGATVAVGAHSDVTDAVGVYTICGAPAGVQSVQTSATGYVTRTDSVNIMAGATTTFSTALVPASAGNDITIVLTWGAQPTDLDAHLVGPNSGGGRFHCYYSNMNPVSYVSLDIDDTSSFGPETISVTTLSGLFVPGSYSYYVDNYSETPDFDVSNAIVSVFQGGAQIAQFLVSAATGDPAEEIWHVFDFTLTATASGQIAITQVQAFTTTSPTLLGGDVAKT